MIAPEAFEPASPRIGAIGLASWDRLLVVADFPSPGGWSEVVATHEGPGGTTANTATALAKLGAGVSFRTVVGDDAPGEAIRAGLAVAGVDTAWLSVRADEPTDAATMIVAGDPPERTILWHKGARLVRGDQIDISALFGHDLVYVDVDDLALYRFLVDLPVHTLPNARLLCSLAYLDNGAPGGLEIVLRADAIVGNAAELCAVADATDLGAAIARVQERMRMSNLRAGVVSCGADGAIAFTATERWHAPAYPIEVVDPTGAGDAFAAGVAYGAACRWPWPHLLRFANAVGALAVTALGAQSAHPSWDDTIALIRRYPGSR